MTSNIGPILVFLESNLSGQLIFHRKVYSRHVTGSVNCKNSSVSFVMKYCPTYTVFKNPAKIQIFITRSCCESLSTRSSYFYNRSSCAGSSLEGGGVLINKLFGTNNWSDCLTKKSRCSTWHDLYSSHQSETAP